MHGRAEAVEGPHTSVLGVPNFRSSNSLCTRKKKKRFPNPPSLLPRGRSEPSFLSKRVTALYHCNEGFEWCVYIERRVVISPGKSKDDRRVHKGFPLEEHHKAVG
jgi:hypothetical protein